MMLFSANDSDYAIVKLRQPQGCLIDFFYSMTHFLE
jgi:hypothetical protein